MNPSVLPPEEALGFLWRKMEDGVPVHRIALAKPHLDEMYFVDTRPDPKSWPELMRWAQLDDAHMGFISRGCRRPHAVVYNLETVENIVSRLVGGSSFIPDDEYQIRLFIRTNILGVWAGEKTPYLFSGQKNPDTIAQIDRWFGQNFESTTKQSGVGND
jgi:hypothetical protein